MRQSLDILLIVTGALFFRRGKGVFMLPEAVAEESKNWLDGINMYKQEEARPAYLLFSLFNKKNLKLDLDEALSDWRESLLRPEPLDGQLPDVLRSYQAYGVSWLAHLCSHHCHPLLADEMGLGKTLQVLSLLNLSKQDVPSLVVCPASVIPVWRNEAAKFFPSLNVETLTQGNGFSQQSGNALWLSSYTQLRRHRHLLKEVEFAYAVLDEAQFIKNPDAKVSQACFARPGKAPYRANRNSVGKSLARFMDDFPLSDAGAFAKSQTV